DAVRIREPRGELDDLAVVVEGDGVLGGRRAHGASAGGEGEDQAAGGHAADGLRLVVAAVDVALGVVGHEIRFLSMGRRIGGPVLVPASRYCNDCNNVQKTRS